MIHGIDPKCAFEKINGIKEFFWIFHMLVISMRPEGKEYLKHHSSFFSFFFPLFFFFFERFSCIFSTFMISAIAMTFVDATWKSWYISDAWSFWFCLSWSLSQRKKKLKQRSYRILFVKRWFFFFFFLKRLKRWFLRLKLFSNRWKQRLLFRFKKKNNDN